MNKKILAFSTLFGVFLMNSCRSVEVFFSPDLEIQDITTQEFIVTVILLAILTFSWVTIGVYFILSRHRVNEKNRALVKVIDELNSRKKTNTCQTGQRPERRIPSYIDGRL